MLRVTLDTNVIVSALNFPGSPARILDWAEAGDIHLAVSNDILDEVKRVLLRPKFGWSEHRVDTVIRQIAGFAEVVKPKQPIAIVVDDPTDNRILECAFASGSDYLVSGDKHLLSVGRYQGCTIMSPAEFLEIQSRRGR